MEIEIEGEIVEQLHHTTKHESQIKLKINKGIYSLKLFEIRSNAIFSILSKGAFLKLKCNLDDNEKKIMNPRDIWVKIS